MKVRMRTTMAGPAGVVQAGRIASVSRKRAKELIDGGYAEPYSGPEKPAKKKETTSAPPADETTSGDEGENLRMPEGKDPDESETETKTDSEKTEEDRPEIIDRLRGKGKGKDSENK